MAKNNSLHATFLHDNSCFDLQFRKDVRHERLNSPTYYRWRVQFVITTPKENIKQLKGIQKIISCGSINVIKNQARFSVQKIDDITDTVIPFLKKNPLQGKKKKDFELWQKAATIIFNNKGKPSTQWKKNDLLSLIQIHKSIAQYKSKPKQHKWIEMAQMFAKTV